MAVYFLSWLSVLGWQLAGDSAFGPPAVRMARLRVLGLRDPTLPLGAANNVTFGLLRSGCPASNAQRLACGGPQVQAVSLPADSAVNGYFLEVPDGPVQADPVRWIVEVSSAEPSSSSIQSEGYDWRAVGASGWYGPYPTSELFPQLGYPMPTQRGLRVVMDCQPSWTWAAAEATPLAILTAGFLLFAISGYLRWERTAEASISALFALNAILHIIAGAGAWAAGDWRSSVPWWMEALPEVLLTASIVFFQRRIVDTMTLFGVLKIVGKVCSHRHRSCRFM